MQEIEHAETMSEALEHFLDEFMLIEYKGKDHIVARKHYGELFIVLIPKYFVVIAPGTK